MVEDPYQILGIPHGATEAEIKKAYRKKAKEYHPDLHPNDPVAMKKMQEVNKAYDMLMNPEKYAARNARWYYLSAVANHGLGNTVQAMDHIQRAIKLDPNNRTYQLLYRQYRQAEQTYETNAQGFDMGAMQIQKVCMGLCLAQMFCNPFGCLRCI